MDQPPPDVDPLVWQVVRSAQATHSPVTLYVRSTSRPEISIRSVTGVPARFDLAPSGDVRVVLAVAPGTEQWVVASRIARARHGTASSIFK